MASMTVIKHVLQKISTATSLEEAVRADERIINMKEALTSFTAQVMVLQEMADLGEETRKQMVWRKRVVGLACRIEDLVDSCNHPLKDLNLFCFYRRKLKNAIMGMYNEIRQEITELRQEHIESHIGGASTHESYGSVGIGYDPCLPLPAVEPDLPGVAQAREISRFLLDGEKQLKGVSIVGFAGMGKTITAVEVYRQIEAEFECLATATVSRKPDMKQLLQHILSQVRPEAPECSEASPELAQLIREIREHLLYKRYLILLDDVWESPSEIMSTLPKNNCGSRIIMTTRIKSLADLGLCGCDAMVYEMERLGVAESENVPFREIFGTYNGCLDIDWRKYYEGIAMRTAARARLENERLSYQDGMQPVGRPASPYDAELELAGKRIMFSYFDLDPFLQTHMMLLCMFPKDFLIERNLLIRILKAEGYANPSLGESTAESILEQLIDRNVILPVKHRDISQVEEWKVYYVMFEAIRLRSAEDNFLISSSMLHLATRSKVRRLALHSHCTVVDFKKWLKTLDLSFVSSLSIFSKANMVSLDKFMHLRVLDIMDWNHLKNRDMWHICNMLLLRYLSIRNTRVSFIPWKIINLRHLETLDVRKTRVKRLPSQVGQLPKLSDLLVGGDQDPSYNTRVKITTGFKYFGSLRTLETIHLSDAWALLGSLQHLAEVTIFCPSQESNYSLEKLYQSLKQCCRLESLTFCGAPGCCMEFLDSLDVPDVPPRNIRKLTVAGTIVTIPRWIATLKNLMVLQIKVCQVQPDDLQKLSELPVLQSLLFGLDFLPEQEMVINGFPALERFAVDCRVPWMAFQPGSMPKLSELELKFREGPANQDSAPSGINHLVNLKRVAIYYSSRCQSSVSVMATVKAIVKAVHDHSGPVKLVINGSGTEVKGVNGDQAAMQENATEDAIVVIQDHPLL